VTNNNNVGLMILPGVTLFPGALLPLYIFEPRYQEMLRAALDGDRMFGIAQAGEDGIVAPVASLGVVRACVANPDGTSNLILQGASRVVLSSLEMLPYPHASATALPDSDPDPAGSAALRGEVHEAFLQLRKSGWEIPSGFEGYLAGLGSPGAYADAVAAVLVHDPVEQRGLLEETGVPVRLSRLLRCLFRQLQNTL